MPTPLRLVMQITTVAHLMPSGGGIHPIKTQSVYGFRLKADLPFNRIVRIALLNADWRRPASNIS